MVSNNKTITLREIAEQTGINYNTLGTMRHNKKWPYGYPPLNLKTRGKGELLFAAGVVEAIKKKQAKASVSGKVTLKPAKTLPVSQTTPADTTSFMDTLPRIIPESQTVEDIAVKLIKADFTEAGLWLLKQDKQGK